MGAPSNSVYPPSPRLALPVSRRHLLSSLVYPGRHWQEGASAEHWEFCGQRRAWQAGTSEKGDKRVLGFPRSQLGSMGAEAFQLICCVTFSRACPLWLLDDTHSPRPAYRQRSCSRLAHGQSPWVMATEDLGGTWAAPAHAHLGHSVGQYIQQSTGSCHLLGARVCTRHVHSCTLEGTHRHSWEGGAPPFVF